MSFNGKATYMAGADLPEIVEDVSDVVGIISPFETPLLDHLGQASRPAYSTVHEWIEDTLLPNTDTINQTTFTPDASNATSVTVANGGRFRVGDQVRPGNATEILLVTGVSGNTLTVARRYGGTPASALANGQRLAIVGNAALEGDDAPAARYTNRTRRQNYTQIFTATVDVSGTMQAVRAHGVPDEIEYQKQERLRELVRDLESSVINGTAAATSPQGASAVRRSMNGILRQLTTHQYTPNTGPIPAGGGAGNNELNESVLSAVMRQVWEQSQSSVDTIVVGGAQKRRINQFVSASNRHFSAETTRFRDMVSVYESDYGVCRVIMSRWMPQDAVLLLDRGRVQVMPLAGRAFHYKPLAATGDSMTGQVIGEYTVELKNEAAHAVIRGLAV